MSRNHLGSIVIAAVLGLSAGMASAATLLPDFTAATFLPGAPITNSYFPVTPGTTTTLAARGRDEGVPIEERSIRSAVGGGPVILGVATSAVRDRAFVNGVLVEETLDYYAQDSAGNVWYFGEDVTNYRYDDAGNLIGTDNKSAWRAGIDGALPGYAMPTDPAVGLAYYQEFAAANGALDEGLVYARGLSLKIAGRLYTDVLAIFETTSLDPTAREMKFYAPGVGLIRAQEGLDENFANPSLTFNLVPAPVPLPAGLPLMAGALGALWWRGRRPGSAHQSSQLS